MPSVRQATLDDCLDLAPRLRKEDAAEVQACSGHTPRDALVGGLKASSRCLAIVNDKDLPVAIYGAIPHPSEEGVGACWMLASEELVKIRFWFLRHCRPLVDDLQKDWPVLWNFVDERNTVHIEWLKWCGFEFLHLHPEFGVEKRPFWEFVRYRQDHV